MTAPGDTTDYTFPHGRPHAVEPGVIAIPNPRRGSRWSFLPNWGGEQDPLSAATASISSLTHRQRASGMKLTRGSNLGPPHHGQATAFQGIRVGWAGRFASGLKTWLGGPPRGPPSRFTPPRNWMAQMTRPDRLRSDPDSPAFRRTDSCGCPYIVGSVTHGQKDVPFLPADNRPPTHPGPPGCPAWVHRAWRDASQPAGSTVSGPLSPRS